MYIPCKPDETLLKCDNAYVRFFWGIFPVSILTKSKESTDLNFCF